MVTIGLQVGSSGIQGKRHKCKKKLYMGGKSKWFFVGAPLNEWNGVSFYQHSKEKLGDIELYAVALNISTVLTSLNYCIRGQWLEPKGLWVFFLRKTWHDMIVRCSSITVYIINPMNKWLYWRQWPKENTNIFLSIFLK